MQDSDPLEIFRRRVLEDFVPGYCRANGYLPEGFRERTLEKVHAEDAHDFLRAVDCGLVVWDGGKAFHAPRSRTGEFMFWELEKAVKPRAFTISLEPIIAIAALARLHLDYGWPQDFMGMQTETDWAFDAAAYLSADSAAEHIACEVKKTNRELDRLVELMVQLGGGATPNLTNSVDRNALKKVEAMRRRRAPYFWAVGPGGRSLAFATAFSGEDRVAFESVELQALRYPRLDLGLDRQTA